MKKILFVAHVDINEKNGAGLATLGFYNALKHLYGDDVVLMMPSEGVREASDNIIGVPPRKRLTALLSGSPHRYKKFLDNYLKDNANKYDVCVLNGGIYAGDMMNMIHGYDLKIVMIHHNFDREYYLDNKSSITFGGRYSFIVDYLEKKAYKKADLNCFLTLQDKELFEKYYGTLSQPHFIVSVFEPEAEKPIKNRTDISRNKKIVISGSLNTVQTLRGIEDVKDHYYDLIKELCPDWDLILAGRNPQKAVYDFQATNPQRIQVIANPPEMKDVTKDASIFLCPTNVGGGLKLRVMDGLRQGLPVLVHEVSARGYNAFYNKDYFQIYNDRPSFQKGLSKLLECYSKGVNAEVIRNDYKETFGFDAGCRTMKCIIETVRNV